MAKSVLTVVNQSTDRQVQGKSRKSLQLLQVSTSKQISAESNLGKKAKKIFKDKEKLPKVAEKENAPLLRRSKRKITTSDSKQNTDSSSRKSKTRKSSTKSIQSVKTKSKPVPELTKKSSTVIKEESPKKVQSNFHFSPTKPVATNKVSEATNPNKNVSITAPSGLSEDSGFESSSRASDQIHTEVVLYSPGIRSSAVSGNEASILTCETLPVNYWTELAEQRRIALETALYENESLHDQLAVLETENSQLKQLIKEAEEFADIVKGIIK